MTIVNNMGKKLGEVAVDAKDKAKDIAELAKTKAEIMSEQKKIQHGYIELGKLLYEKVKDTGEGPEADICASIKESFEKISVLEAKITNKQE